MLIQWQFEEADGCAFYVETHDENYIEHFRFSLLEGSLSGLPVEINRSESKIIEIILDLALLDCQAIARVTDVLEACVDGL